MTAVTESGNPNFFRQAVSAEVILTATIEIELSGDFASQRNVQIGIQMFDVGGDLILDSAGTVTVTYQTVNTKQYEATSGAIDATAPDTLAVSGNLFKIKAVPALLSDTVTWRVVATANRN